MEAPPSSPTTIAVSAESTLSTSASSSVASSRMRLFSGTASAGSLNTVWPVDDESRTTPSISDWAPALMGMHSRPSLMTICARSAKFFFCMCCAFCCKSALSSRSVSLRSARIAASVSEASSRTLPPGIITHLRISRSSVSGTPTSGAASRRRGSSASSFGAWMRAWTLAHAAAVVATSAREEPLSTLPLAAPAIHGLTSFVPSKTSLGKPPCTSRSVAAAVVSASNVALSSGVAPRGKVGVHARTPRVVAVNARTCALSSGHCSRSLASASRSSAVGSPSSSRVSSSSASSCSLRLTSSVKVAPRLRFLPPVPRRNEVAGRETRRPDAAFDEIRSIHDTCAAPVTADAVIFVRLPAPRAP